MASTVSLIQMLASGVVTSSGAAVASGKVRFYLPGTLTPVSVYSDTAAATPIAPPLTLTAGGTGVAYTKVPTRVIVKDSLEVTTYFDGLVNIERAEQLYIQSAAVNGGTETTLQTWLDAYSTSFGGAAGLWKVKVASSATERNLIDVLNDVSVSVKSYGATGGGAVDDWAAMQAAITAVASAGGGNVLFPAGTYLSSAPLTWSGSAVRLVGQSANTTIIKNTSTTANAITVSGTAKINDIAIQASTSSSGVGISATGVDLVNVGSISHGTGVLITSNDSTLVNCAISGTTTAGLSVTSTTPTTLIVGGSYSATIGSGISAVSTVKALGVNVTGSVAGISIGASGSLYANGVVETLGNPGLVTNATSGTVFHQGCKWGTGVTDGRTGAPVAYSIGTTTNVVPLPLQTDVVRVLGTAGGITVTISNPAYGGFGRDFNLICSNTSGGAVTWSFGGNYVLSGAVAPATGNRVNLRLTFDAISGKYYEVGRAATAN